VDCRFDWPENRPVGGPRRDPEDRLQTGVNQRHTCRWTEERPRGQTRVDRRQTLTSGPWAEQSGQTTYLLVDQVKIKRSDPEDRQTQRTYRPFPPNDRQTKDRLGGKTDPKRETEDRLEWTEDRPISEPCRGGPRGQIRMGTSPSCWWTMDSLTCKWTEGSWTLIDN